MRTGNSGKWLVFVDRALVDEVWGKIKEATEEGRLGGSSKVSTPRRHQPSGRATSHVICVYTYDFTDEADVRQVREALRQLGIVVRIPYKADQDTRSGKYAALGDRNLSKYFE